MKNPLPTSLVAAVIVLGGVSLLVHPFGAVRAHALAGPLLTGAVVDAETLRILQRSCQNCHSQNTDWPWYSYIAPASSNTTSAGANHSTPLPDDSSNPYRPTYSGVV